MLAAGSVLWLFHMGLGLTVVVVGAILLGGLGVWRLADLFPSNRERIVALVTYVAMPLLPGVISTGRLSALVAFAALPWFVHLVRSAAGIGTADPNAVAADLADGVHRPRRARANPAHRRRRHRRRHRRRPGPAGPPPRRRRDRGARRCRRCSSGPAGGPRRGCSSPARRAAAIGWVLNLPAATTWSWNDLTAVPLAGAPGRGLDDVASMNIGRARLSLLTLALYVPVITGLVLSRAWRLTWAGRAAGLVVTFGVLAVLQDRDALPFRVPEVGILLVPVALGLALAAACAVASFASDVAGGTFGWRQPLGVVSIAAVLCGTFPALVTLTDGWWFAPRTTMMTLLGPRVAADDFGDFRVLYIGDPRVLPAAPHDLGDGVAYALTGPGVPQIADRWTAPGTDADDELARRSPTCRSGATQRGGRLLAPYAIRYIVVPHIDGGQSTASDPIDPPTGLTDAFERPARPPSPVHVAELRRLREHRRLPRHGGVHRIAGGRAPPPPGPPSSSAVTSAARRPCSAGRWRPGRRPARFPPGVVALAVPFDEQWTMERRRARTSPPSVGFGALTAFDVADGRRGRAALRDAVVASRRAVRPGGVVGRRPRRGEPPARCRRGARVGRGGGDRRAVIDLAEDVELPTDAGDVPVMVPLEPVGVAARTAAAGAAVPSDAVFGRRRCSAPTTRRRVRRWVDEMFADEDDDVK